MCICMCVCFRTVYYTDTLLVYDLLAVTFGDLCVLMRGNQLLNTNGYSMNIYTLCLSKSKILCSTLHIYKNEIMLFSVSYLYNIYLLKTSSSSFPLVFTSIHIGTSYMFLRTSFCVSLEISIELEHLRTLTTC